jgi:predicted 2-oxoglutarate/Fe(II)-dependent dioxygenase YbiX
VVATMDDFYVVAHEPGAEHPALPSWANTSENPLGLGNASPRPVRRVEVPEVPGAYQLLDVLSIEECQSLIEASEAMGYLPDAAVSLPRYIRHNDNLVWVVDEQTERNIWQRVVDRVQEDSARYGGSKALGLNARFRFYRYGSGDYFKPHSDGAWPGSRVIDENLVTNAYADRYSRATFLIFLTENYVGGATRFLVNASNPDLPARRGDSIKEVDVRTPAGGVLCFPHGDHPQHCIHSSEPIEEGIKYIIRTDTLYSV